MAAGVMLLKVCHMDHSCCHHTHHGMSCLSVSNLLNFDSILFIGEKEADKVFEGTFRRYDNGSWGWGSSNIELYVMESEGGKE